MESNIDFDKMRTRLYFMFSLAHLVGVFERDMGAPPHAVDEICTKVTTFGGMLIHCQRLVDTQGIPATEMLTANNTVGKLITQEFITINRRIRNEIGAVPAAQHSRDLADRVDAMAHAGIDRLMVDLKRIYNPVPA